MLMLMIEISLAANSSKEQSWKRRQGFRPPMVADTLATFRN